MNKPKTTEVGRLALRHEGEFWNAYYVPQQDSMMDALLLGSIRIGYVQDAPDRRQAFMDLMRGIVDVAIHEAFGERPCWGDPRTAPEGERSGHG